MANMIEVRPRGGLCNRMRVIASAVALASDTDKPLQIRWMLNDELNCSFSEIFKTNIAFKVKERQNYFSTFFQKVFIRDKKKIFSNDSIYAKRNAGWNYADFKLFFSEQAAQNSIVIDTDWNFYPTGSEGFNCLQPIEELRRIIDRISSDFKRDKVIGVHIRRTDHAPSIQESPLELFLEAMRREREKNPSAKFFLATDDLIVQNSLMKEFEGSIITYSTNKKRNSSQAIKEAVIDLYCLANTNQIIGSYWSSFSETASELKGAPLTIIKK